MQRISCKLPAGFSSEELLATIKKESGYDAPFFRIASQSLDARKKSDIHQFLHIDVDSKPLEAQAVLSIPSLKEKREVVVVGLGPAGYFTALVLATAGCSVVVIEKGRDVESRSQDIVSFEAGGHFVETSNYLFGEGGAGTFSDGKLTSRTKSIKLERNYIHETYVAAGAPSEILYMAKPHVGSDNLRVMMPKLRKKLTDLGVVIHFDARFEGYSCAKKRFTVTTSKGDFSADSLFVAPGHSSYETYRSLIDEGVLFKTKPFAIGSRVEHPQSLINRAQWGKESIAGVKAAEYALSWHNDRARTYTFCMCPGGTVVPAASTAKHSGVNGASLYSRSGDYCNSAVVAAFMLEDVLDRDVEPQEVLDFLDEQSQKLYNLSNSHNMPAVKVEDFINRRTTASFTESSYPFSLFSYDFDSILPKPVSYALRKGLSNFTRKIDGFGEGVLIGTELTTSAPLQVERDRTTCATNVPGLYVVGEGSGFAGGIISSGADGVRTANAYLRSCGAE